MNKIMIALVLALVVFGFTATTTTPSTYKVESISGDSYTTVVLKTTLANKGDSAFSNPIAISGISFRAYDSLGQKLKIDFTVGTFTVVCKDVQDTNSTTTVDSVNTAIFIRASDLAGNGSDPSYAGSDAWYAVDSAKVLGNGDGGALVKRTKSVSLASEAPQFIRIVLKGLSGNSYSVPSCTVSLTKKTRK